MVWIFLSVVLVLAVIYPGFRKVVLWIFGIGAAIVLLYVLDMIITGKG